MSRGVRVALGVIALFLYPHADGDTQQPVARAVGDTVARFAYTRTKVVDGRDSAVFRRSTVSVRQAGHNGRRVLSLVMTTDGTSEQSDSALVDAASLAPIHRALVLGAFRFVTSFDSDAPREIRTRPVPARGTKPSSVRVDTVPPAPLREDMATITNEIHLRLVLARVRLHDGWSMSIGLPREASSMAATPSVRLRVVGSGNRRTATGVRDAWRVRAEGDGEGASQLWIDKQTGDLLGEEILDSLGDVTVRVDWRAY
jgi:hypothetical protein